MATDDANILGSESGDWVQPIYIKNQVQKSHATVPLTMTGWFSNTQLCELLLAQPSTHFKYYFSDVCRQARRMAPNPSPPALKFHRTDI